LKLRRALNISPLRSKARMCDYEPKGRGNKKKDKAKEKFERNGKNTARGVRHMEQVQTQVQKQSKAKANEKG
jgi:hypothetical protein